MKKNKLKELKEDLSGNDGIITKKELKELLKEKSNET